MKHLFTALIMSVFTASACQNAQNKVATESTETPKSEAKVVFHFKGIVPCADCDGIETEVQMLSDNTYIFSRTYLGKNQAAYHQTGTYHFDETGGIATLEKMEAPNHFMFVGGDLAQLDMQGNLVTGDLASLYLLAPVTK